MRGHQFLVAMGLRNLQCALVSTKQLDVRVLAYDGDAGGGVCSKGSVEGKRAYGLVWRRAVLGQEFSSGTAGGAPRRDREQGCVWRMLALGTWLFLVSMDAKHVRLLGISPNARDTREVPEPYHRYHRAQQGAS